MSTCFLCKRDQVRTLLDFGPQPICNRFPTSPDEKEALFPMRIGQCQACGTVQSTAPLPAAELKPFYDWITYNEPEGHLDRLADDIAALPGLTKESTICGISFKDDSLLRRLRERCYPRTWRLDPATDLGISEAGIGVETIQDRWNPSTARKVAQSRGKADVVIARHIWEHTSDPANFVAALKELATPRGYIVLEIPDCERALESCDYSTVWEEHTIYFTPATFRGAVPACGLSLIYFKSFPYTLENSLVAIGQLNGEGTRNDSAGIELEKEKERAEKFAHGLAGQREKMGDYFARFRRERGRIALLGAGHLAATFINLLQVTEHFDCLVDDNPHKRGLFMPGSRLPIYESKALLDRDIKLCLLSVNAETEDRVIQKNHAFTQAGGTFHSIFPASKYALPV